MATLSVLEFEKSIDALEKALKFHEGLISDIDVWFDFIDARNKSSDTYDEKIAQEVFSVLQPFLPLAKELMSRLKTS